ncbi:MAG: aminodeoxychorismate synthase component I [Beggiatoa sp. IS2]|nr:MAG: aminodeoxychorismate synthase component I [Beggiatoa sp. IS2]
MKDTLNEWGNAKIPFFFMIDFAVKNFYISPFSTLDDDIFFVLDEFSHFFPKKPPKNPCHNTLLKKPVHFARYVKAFDYVLENMRNGNTYLLNLTFPTEIEIDCSLLTVFLNSTAKFRLYFKDKFVVFSPERFIKIENNLISTFPMKGTINADIPNAQAKILADEKEMAEHVMVVDLLRNDLSIVAKKVRATKFRYVEKISAGNQGLLQVSSEISGVLENSWHGKIGDILWALLPAGSISGAPKKKTVEIIQAVEGYDRGFFTGIFGYFDGKIVDSAVMIRFVEKQGDKFIYKSGGGITIDSDAQSEYQEMLAKVYLPV